MRKKRFNENYITAAVFLTLIFSFLYVSARLFYFIIADILWYEKLLSALLLSAEIFGLVHSAGYFLTIMTTIKQKDKNIAAQEIQKLETFPPVAILVPSYKEPIEILRDTLICFYNLSYPNKYLYLLDDSRYDKPWDTPEKVEAYKKEVEKMCEWIGVNLFRRKWRGAKAGIINDFLKFKEGDELENLQYHPYQTTQSRGPEKYLIVFDADMNPLPDFVERLVYHMEKEPKAAFIQTPQYYTNFETNRVARAAGLQQVIFFEYICESKGIKDAMFCCGTNVLLRKQALGSVGGFDESSITEDFATSLKLMVSGWKTLYFNQVSAFGMGPEDLGAYFKQQSRWALGTLNLGKTLPFIFIENYKKFTFAKMWEYTLSGTHYFVGWFFFIMVIFPILFLLFNVPSYFLSPQMYVFIFLPYFFITLLTTFWTLYLRNYKPIYLLNSMLISSISFPILIKAAFYSFIGRKGSFTVTPKEGGAALSLTALWPQITLMCLCLFATFWGIERMYYEREPFFALFINTFWCFLNFCILSSVFYFNNPEGEPCFRN